MRKGRREKTCWEEKGRGRWRERQTDADRPTGASLETGKIKGYQIEDKTERSFALCEQNKHHDRVPIYEIRTHPRIPEIKPHRCPAEAQVYETLTLLKCSFLQSHLVLLGDMWPW